MPVLSLVVAHDPRLLLERAAAPFLEPPAATLDDPFPTPDTLLVLRQGGLRDDLIRLAAERGVTGWFDPPLCVFHELPEWLGATGLRPCGDVERGVLLARVFREVGGEVFSHLRRKEDYLDSVSRLFGELSAEGVSADEFETACEARTGRDSFELGRDGELVRAYRLYRHRLDERGMRDGRDALIDAARCVVADPGALSTRLRGRRAIHVVGLNDLRGGWRALLRALAECPALDRVEVHTSVELDLGGIPHETRVVDEAPTLATRLFGGEEGGCGRVRLVAAPDLSREAEEVACRVRALVDGGVALQRIAVVSRQARPHVDRVVQALESVGVPASARRRIGLDEVPVVRAILALFGAAASGWTRAGLSEVAEHPYLESSLEPAVIDYVGYRERVVGLDAWELHLSRLLERAEAAERQAGEREDEGRRDRPPAAARVRSALEGLRAFRENARRLEAARPLAEWVALLAELLEGDSWGFERRIHAVPAGHVRAVRPDLSGWKALKGLVREWRDALDGWGGGEEVLGAGQFVLALREALRGDVPLWTEAHRGVPVLEALAAAYRSFDHVFVVGMEAGSFPVRPPSSPILDEAERDALIRAGLPLDPVSAWERREEELFRSLVAGAARSLTLSYSAMDSTGREVIVSSFVEAVGDVAAVEEETIPASRVLTPRFPSYLGADALGRAQRAARIERLRQTGRPSPYNGQVEDPELLAWLEVEFGDDRLWSPTQLESFAKCPWSYLATRLLRLEAPADPGDELDPTVRGRVLHAVLERLYTAARERCGGAPVLLGEADLEWALARVERELDIVLGAFAEREWLGDPVLHGARRAELLRMLRKYVEFEIDHNRKLRSNRSPKGIRTLRTGVVEHEVEFDDVALEVDGVVVRFRGFIDRVEQGIDERVESGHFVAAVDYKTTASSVPGGGDDAAWDDDVVLQVPLYAYALGRIRPEKTVSRIEYRTIKSREVKHALHLHTIEEGGVLVEDGDARDQMERALGAVARHVKAARAGSFPARPAPSCKCSPFCVAWDVCRVKGGPEKKAW